MKNKSYLLIRVIYIVFFIIFASLLFINTIPKTKVIPIMVLIFLIFNGIITLFTNYYPIFVKYKIIKLIFGCLNIILVVVFISKLIF